MIIVVTGICAFAAAFLVIRLRRDAILIARRDPGHALASNAAIGISVEATTAALIVIHLFGYMMNGLIVLLILGAVGNIVSALFHRAR